MKISDLLLDKIKYQIKNFLNSHKIRTPFDFVDLEYKIEHWMIEHNFENKEVYLYSGKGINWNNELLNSENLKDGVLVKFENKLYKTGDVKFNGIELFTLENHIAYIVPFNSIYLVK